MTQISVDAYTGAVQNGTIKKLEQFVIGLLGTHTSLTINEARKIITDMPGLTKEAVADHTRTIVSMLPSLDTKGQLRKSERICDVTGNLASAYYLNLDYTKTKQPEFEFERVLVRLSEVQKKYNELAVQLGKPGITILSNSLLKELEYAVLSLKSGDFDSLEAAGKRVEEIYNDILK